MCPNGGIGRRARFRTWFSQGSGGSSPLSGTKFNLNSAMDAVRDLRFSVLDTHEVSALLLLPGKATCLLVMAHGAGAGMKHSFMEAMAHALAANGVGTLRYQFPYMEQQRRVPDAPKVLTATVAAAVNVAAKAAPKLPLFAGGKSMGGFRSARRAAVRRRHQVHGRLRAGIARRGHRRLDRSGRPGRRPVQRGVLRDLLPGAAPRAASWCSSPNRRSRIST